MKKRKGTGSFLKQKSYMLAAVLMLAAVFGMTGVYVSEQRTEKKKQEQLALLEQERLEQEAEEVNRVIPPENDDFLDAPDVVSTGETDPAAQNPAADPAADTGAQTDPAPTVEPALHFDAANDMQWPLKGNVIMNYSMNQTVYFATLDQYKYNPALVIQGKVNDKVLSVADGKISNVESNEVTGCTVTVDLGDGYSAIYGQLKEVKLGAGDTVAAGETIGYVNEPTKYYSVEGPNLYFQMVKDNQSVDPMGFLE